MQREKSPRPLWPSSLLSTVLLCAFASSGCIAEQEEPDVASQAQAAEVWNAPYAFPSRGLASNHFWRVSEFGEGANVLDMHVVRWDSDINEWTRRPDGVSESDYNSNKTNGKNLVFGLPLYAPVDGRIISCWRNFPDNPTPGQKLPAVVGNGVNFPKTIFQSGNHIVIESDDGNIFLVAHLKQGSVPTSLCPYNATTADVTKLPGASYPTASFIAQANRPFVRRGERIGSAGNSGNSTGPHIHITVKPQITETTNGAGAPIKWFAAWAQPNSEDIALDPNAWYPLDSTAITDSVGPTILWPSPFLRRGSGSEYNVINAATIEIGGLGLATAAKDSSGDLRVTTWGVTPSGDVNELATDSAGTASHVHLAKPGFGRDFVVAMRTAAGNLKLIYWDVAIGGGLTRKQSASAGAVGWVDVVRTPTGGSGVLTAVRTSAGRAKVIAWDTTSSGTIEREGSATGGYVTTISATAVSNGRSRAEEGATSSRFAGAVTASIAGGNLKLSSWRVSSNLSVTLRDTETAGAISDVAITTVAMSGLRDVVVTALRTTSNRLKLIAWEINSAGQISRLGSIYAGGITKVDAKSPSTSTLVTSVRRSNGKLKLISWELTNSGEFRRLGDHSAGSIKNTSLTGRFVRGGRSYMAAVVKTTANALKVIAFETNL